MKISKNKLKQQRLIMDKKLSVWKRLRSEKRPPSGWLKAIRGALGINTRQLAKRCGVQHSSILRIEKSEIQDKISIESLKKIAGAMNCQLVYAIVPKTDYGSLEEIINYQSEILARKLIKKADHTMKLEAQGLSSRELKRQSKKIAHQLKEKMDFRLWESDFKYKKNR